MKKQENPGPCEQGAAIVWIFIFIVLLAGLAVVLTRNSNTTVGAMSGEQARLAASEIMQYGTGIKNAVRQLQINGCKDTEISFLHSSSGTNYDNPNAPDDHSCDVFHPAGGGMNVVEPPSVVNTLNTSYNKYRFIGRSGVQDVGTAEGELILWLRTRSRDVCVKYNQLVGINNPSASEAPTDSGFYGTPLFIGAYSAGTTVSGGGVFDGKMTGCHKDAETDTDGQPFYDFYQVLIAR